MKIEDVVVPETTLEKRDRNRALGFDSNIEIAPDVRISAEREIVVAKGNKVIDTGGAYGERRYSFSVLLSQIATRSITLPAEYGGIKLNALQLAIGTEMLSDLLAIEFNTPATPPTPEEPTVSTFTLTVNSGTGSGEYAEGATQAIIADEAPEGQVFDMWTGDVGCVADVYAPATTVTMPSSDASLLANYKDA